MDDVKQLNEESQQNIPPRSSEVSDNNHHIHKVHKLSRYFLLFAALIAIASSILVLYLYFTYQQPQTSSPISISKPQTKIVDDMANWNTYSNEVLGISLKHPPDSKIISENLGESHARPPGIDIAFPTIDSELFTLFYFSIQNTYKGQETPEESVENAIASGRSNKLHEYSYSTIPYFFNGNKTTKLVSKISDLNREDITVFIEKNNKLYMFNMRFKIKDEEKASIIFDQILSTFKFLH